MYFFYDFKTIEGSEKCNHKVSKSDFNQEKMDDEKYIRSFLKKHSSTYLPSCEIVSCEKYCEWFVKIQVDLSKCNVEELIGKTLAIDTLNYLLCFINKDKYNNLFDSPNSKGVSKLKEKYYKQGYLLYEKSKTKIIFDTLPENENGPDIVKVTQIIIEQ